MKKSFTANEIKIDPETKDSNITLPRNEVIRRLRDRGHPILLYGETEQQSFKRLRRIEIQEPEANKVRFTRIKLYKDHFSINNFFFE